MYKLLEIYLQDDILLYLTTELVYNLRLIGRLYNSTLDYIRQVVA